MYLGFQKDVRSSLNVAFCLSGAVCPSDNEPKITKFIAVFTKIPIRSTYLRRPICGSEKK